MVTLFPMDNSCPRIQQHAPISTLLPIDIVGELNFSPTLPPRPIVVFCRILKLEPMVEQPLITTDKKCVTFRPGPIVADNWISVLYFLIRFLLIFLAMILLRFFFRLIKIWCNSPPKIESSLWAFKRFMDHSWPWKWLISHHYFFMQTLL